MGRPHSRKGRTAQTRELQRLRKSHRRHVAMLVALSEPEPEPIPSHIYDLMVWYRIRHRRDRKSARRAAHWRLRMLDRRVHLALRGFVTAWGGE